MWMMLQYEKPDDYVICTGNTHSVKQFCEKAFSHVGLDYEKYVISDTKFFRPAEVDILQGDYSKAKQTLGWQPAITFDKLVTEMVDHDIEYLSKKKVLL
jgi:GDPmannose 4,6-dehydratase